MLAGPTRFARDVRGELRRVSWPDRDQLRQSTAVVLIIVVVLALYVAALDVVFQSLVRMIFL
ncbi:MAG TPA: preprotein translocase subunit SecE [Rubrobacter sp.]|nr:preprotein translocase subunit SecE [Rubrobacter sp.]